MPRDLAFCHTDLMEPRVLGVLGGRDMDEGSIVSWARSAGLVYAADSGANTLLRHGVRPVVVGDLDSFDQNLADPELRVVQDLDQDTTDCDKLLGLVRADGHKSLTMIGVDGDLLDHVLSSLSSFAKSTLRIRLILRRATGYVVRGGDSIDVGSKPGDRISLIPLALSQGVSLHGVVWELDHQAMEPAGFISVSNASTGTVSVRLESGAAVLFVARSDEEPPMW